MKSLEEFVRDCIWSQEDDPRKVEKYIKELEEHLRNQEKCLQLTGIPRYEFCIEDVLKFMKGKEK